MALVDYTSDSDAEAEEPLPKNTGAVPSGSRPSRPPTASHQPENCIPESSSHTPATQPHLPPLPSAFHDLYASTVRTSNVDDSSLHHGRTRQIPHVAGNWPSHIYIEWFPTHEEHALLSSLITALAKEVGDSAELHSFLSSELSTPLPLHISLSRPFVLKTDEKDDFLEQLTASVSGSNVQPFTLHPYALNWYRSPDSPRAFLVLRTKVAAPGNPQLESLLQLSNDLVAGAGQPTLYTDGKGVASAFHVSLAWSFVEDLEALEGLTSDVYSREEFQDRLPALGIEVSGVKAKIGNVVANIALPGVGRRGMARGRLFGVG